MQLSDHPDSWGTPAGFWLVSFGVPLFPLLAGLWLLFLFPSAVSLPWILPTYRTLPSCVKNLLKTELYVALKQLSPPVLSCVKDGLGLPCGTEALGAAAREPLTALYVCGSLVRLSCVETEMPHT